jgi:hypothetical protein
MRSGFEVSRYADDFKVLASDWGAANGVVEEAAEVARRFGLILSSEKTAIRKRSTLQQRVDDRIDFLMKYFQDAKDELKSLSFVFGDYGDGVFAEAEPDEKETTQAALRKVFSDWVDGQNQKDSADTSLHGQFLPASLRVLSAAPERIPDSWLRELVFRQPLRLENVCAYVLARDEEAAQNWETLKILAKMERQSPWAKIWLLQVADGQEPSDDPWSDATSVVTTWAKAQLSDKHEVVRCQAAWLLAGCKEVPEDELASLFKAATSISRPAIAATAGRRGVVATSGLGKAIQSESPLTRKAFEWGASM